MILVHAPTLYNRGRGGGAGGSTRLVGCRVVPAPEYCVTCLLVEVTMSSATLLV